MECGLGCCWYTQWHCANLKNAPLAQPCSRAQGLVGRTRCGLPPAPTVSGALAEPATRTATHSILSPEVLLTLLLLLPPTERQGLGDGSPQEKPRSAFPPPSSTFSSPSFAVDLLMYSLSKHGKHLHCTNPILRTWRFGASKNKAG